MCLWFVDCLFTALSRMSLSLCSRSVLQALHGCSERAVRGSVIPGCGLEWAQHYREYVESDQHCLNEWAGHDWPGVSQEVHRSTFIIESGVSGEGDQSPTSRDHEDWGLGKHYLKAGKMKESMALLGFSSNVPQRHQALPSSHL